MDITGAIVEAASRRGLEFAHPEYLRYLWLVAGVWAVSALAARRAGIARLVSALLLRTAVFLLVILALAGLSARETATLPPTVLAAVDVSESMGGRGRAWAMEQAGKILAIPGTDALKGIIFFARGCEMRSPPARELPAGPETYSISTDATDISSAIDAASLAFPTEGPRRLIVFSDGNENSGNARDAAERAARAGIRIDCFSPPEVKRPRTSLKRIDLPEEASVSEKFAIRVLAENRGGSPVESSLALRDGEDVIKEWPVTLQPGTNAFELPYGIASPGAHRISASLTTGEAVDSASAPVLIVDRPKVLCLSGSREGQEFLARALEMKDIDVKTGGAELLPATMEELLRYDCVVLSNFPRAALGDSRMKMLRDYVREHGGGLVMVGGADSFGPGGYRGTPVEEALPVTMERAVPFEKEKKARLCIVLVIDKSGSMGWGFGVKMMAARRAAEELVKQLAPNDMVGVIPFDAFYEILVPLGPVGDRKAAIIDRIRMIEAGGDTLAAKPLEQALAQMQGMDGKAEHVILITDGQTKDLKYYDYRRLIAAFARNGVTVSTVGIGRDADSDFLRAVALGTGGDYYYVEDATTLPLIVLEDTRKVLEKSGFLEETIVPKIGEKSAMLAGIRQGQIPDLLGYVITKAKDRAEVALYTDVRGLRDPLLAGWRYGLGRTAAFTSDAEARWGKKMVAWKMFSKFWTQVVRWAMRERSADFYIARLRAGDGTQRVEIETFNPLRDGESLIAMSPAGPSGKRNTVQLHQVAPHTYAGDAGALSPDADSIVVEKRSGRKVIDRKEVALRKPASRPPDLAETRTEGNDEELLRDIASATGGQLNPPDPSFPADEVPARRSLAGLLMPFVFLLLLADIAVRKLWV